MVEIKNLGKRVKGTLVLQGIDLYFGRKEIWGIAGPNGAGKSILLKVLATLIKPSVGSVLIDDLDILRRTREVRKRIGYAGKVYNVLDDRLTVWEELNFSAGLYGMRRRKKKEAIEKAMLLFGLQEERNLLPSSLADGARSRLLLARASLHEPDLVLLDDPLSNLDPMIKIGVRDVLREYARGGRTVVIASNVIEELEQLCTHIVILKEGAPVTRAKAEDIKGESWADYYRKAVTGAR